MDRFLRRAALATAVVASRGVSSVAVAGGRPDAVIAGLNAGRPHQAGELIVKFRDGSTAASQETVRRGLGADKIETLRRGNGNSGEIALMGDLNLAPEDEDVFDITRFATSTHVTEPERAAVRGFLEDGYVDVVRPHAVPGAFTYWDYYRQRFERDRGMRIDLVLGSPELAERVTGAFVDREERAGKGASDHAPVVVDLS